MPIENKAKTMTPLGMEINPHRAADDFWTRNDRELAQEKAAEARARKRLGNKTFEEMKRIRENLLRGKR